MIRRYILVVASLSIAALAMADQEGTATATSSPDAPALEQVLVTGEQPGPALWKVSSGDHVLWLLGDVSPLPAKVKWRSKQFERLLADSQEVLFEEKMNSMRPNKLQIAAASRARKLPDGQTLKDVISPELYERVDATRKIFGTREPIDELRPFDAANRIYMGAMRSMDLKARSARIAVAKLAQKDDVRMTTIATPGQTFDDYLENLERGSTVPCLEEAVENLDDGGSGIRRLANAWSVGDIDELRRLVPLYAALNQSHNASKCLVALYGGEQQANAYIERQTEAWLSAAERALHENRSTMAVVPIAELFDGEGYLARLREKGYEVVAPQ